MPVAGLWLIVPKTGVDDQFIGRSRALRQRKGQARFLPMAACIELPLQSLSRSGQ